MSRQAHNEKLHNERQALQVADLNLRAWQHNSSLNFQAEQQEANRQTQIMLADAQRLLTVQEGERNRAIMKELEALRQAFQAHENQLSRELTLRVEQFRAEMQRWVIAEQKATQLQLKEIDVQLARELRQLDRETALNNIREQRRLQNLPVCVSADQLLSSDMTVSPLHVFISPPRLRAERVAHANATDDKDPTRLLPPMETHLATKLRAFFQYYNAQQRPVNLVSGAWMSKTLHGDAAALQVFGELKTESVLILESSLEGYTFTLNYAFWGMNWDKPRYNTALSLNWRETLFDLVKIRMLEWQEKQVGKTPEQVNELYGKTLVERYVSNLKIMERERTCAEEGIDVAEIDRPYFIVEKDYNTLIALLIAYQCLFSGLLTDEYYLLHVPTKQRHPPLLPSLLAHLPELLSANQSGLNVEIPSESLQEIIQVMATFYESLYLQLAAQEPAWMPELYLELAESLSGLTDKTNAKQQLAHSLTTFVNLRKGESVAMVVMASDAPYIQRVNQCFQTIGESSFFDIVTICYQRGLQALATAREAQAVVDFSQAIELHQQFEEAYYQRGLAQNLLGLPAAAVTDFSRAIELNSQAAETYYHRARAYDELGAENPEQYYPLAIADFETCLKLNPQHPQARHDLGVAQASWKRYHSEVERKKREAEEKRKAELEAEKKRLAAAEAKRQAEQAEKERLEREKGKPLTFSTLKAGKMETFTVYEKVFDIKGTQLVMVYIPEGTLQVGSKTFHLQPFYLGKFPVTQRQYQTVMGENPSHFKNGDNFPVENMYWKQAKEFCEKLSTLTRQKFRLPSEAQWEYACRAGTTTDYWWGNSMDNNRCWYDSNSGDKTHRVDEKVNEHTNPFGLCDMHGNVWEWCQDEWHSDFKDAKEDGTPYGSENGDGSRLLRGGSWGRNSGNCCSAFRCYYSDGSDLNGFRVLFILSC